MDLNFKIESIEKDCAIFGNYFHNVVTDMKATAPVWEDFVNKGTKLHGILKTTSVAISAFLDSLQKIADVTTQSKGVTKDLGSILTRLCVRQKMMEAKLRQFTSIMLERLLLPLQDKLDEWKKSSAQLEKDHAKEYKKATNEIRKKSNDTLRLQKKFRKGSKSDVQYQLSTMMQDVNDKFILLGEGEKSAVRNLLIEERSRVCFLSSCLAPVLEVEVSMLNEVSHLQDLLNDLSRLTKEPKQLPNSAEQLLTDLDVNNLGLSASISSGQLSQTHGISPPSSPNTSDSRKSSMCSLNSSDSRSSSSQSHNSGSFSFHNKSTNHMPPTVSRLMSISSHDSGFSSTITNESSNGRSKPASPTHQSRLYHQHSTSEIDVEATSPVIRATRSMSTPNDSPTKLHISKNSYHHSVQYQNPYNNADITPLPSKPTLSSARATNVTNNTGSNQHSAQAKYGVCDPGFFEPPTHNKADEPSRSPPIPSWEVDDLPPPPPELLENASIVPQMPPPMQATDDQMDSNVGIIQTAEDDIKKLQENFARNSSISNSSSHNQPVALGSRSSLTSNDFLATMTLGRKNSNNSLQYSSGYSSQHSTPACSEDTIASHDTDYGSMEGEEVHPHDNMREFERWSTLPRQRHQPQKSGQRAQRPASTAGFPNGQNGPTIINTPGTATIKRKPSSKFSSVGRRPNAPMPVAPPTAPPITPTAPISNHYTANQNKPYLKRHQSEGMFVGVNSHYYYNNNNTHNGFLKSNTANEDEFAPPLPPRDTR